MSDNIPFHIQEEILERLPVKSLIKFQSVSKAWRSLINSSDFIAAHSRCRHTQPEHLLVQYHDQLRHMMKTYTFLVDDDTSPQQRFVQTLPLSIKYSLSPRIIGSSHGLLCVTIGDFKVDIWNPSISKSIRIPLPPASSSFTFLSFGVCPITLDPKIFNMRQCVDWGNTDNDYTTQCKAMVYTLSSGKWRQISSNNLPTKAVMYPKVPHVIIDRFIYWLAYYPSTTIHMIMSFDMTNESFEVIDLPHSLTCTGYNHRLTISKLRGSLVIYESSITTEDQIAFVAWMMKHDAERSFTKHYTIVAQHESVMKLVGFRRSDQPILEVKHKVELKPSKLVVYEPNLKHFRDLEISGASNDLVVKSYEETLFLLGRSDCISDSQ